MASILIAYSSNCGQTARIARWLARMFSAQNHTVELWNLAQKAHSPDKFDAIIVAASVHAGRHSSCVTEFIQQYKSTLEGKTTALLSVSLSAAAHTDQGRAKAQQQMDELLSETGWNPTYRELVAGAFSYSESTWLWKQVFRFSQILFRKQLAEEGWPPLDVDKEYTDWSKLREFVERFQSATQS